MKILIIEDDQRIAKSIKKGLEQESFAVDLALDGETGFDLAVGEEYGLIILDLMLPKLSGKEICRKLRQEENIDTPILMLTARSEVDDRVEGLNLGADDYLTKPFAFVELVARVKALSRRPKKRTAQVLKHQDLLLDTSNFQLSRAGQEIQLSRKEFALLAFLLSHKGKTVTKEQIISHVWDYEADILPNTVEVFIGFLRKKIDKPFAKKKKLIETVRGFGYRIR
jgi:DNA-binding response OmpR family regulator